MANIRYALSIALLTMAVFIFTKLSLTSPFKLHLSLALILGLIIYTYLLQKRGEVLSGSKTYLYLLMATVLAVVGSTGWFFSPFFFSLYLLAIMLSFIFTPLSSWVFIGSLVSLFSFNIGEVDLAYDFLVVLSLLTTIPLSLYLRKEYIKLKESKKDILVLEKDQTKFASKVEEVLSNKINSLSVNLRQPINDIRLLGHRLDKKKSKEDLSRDRERIISSSEEALRVLKEFEEGTTGKKLLSSMPATTETS